jgi:hypothetical protein
MPSLAQRLAALPYRAPRLGRDYWILDKALARPDEVRARLLGRTDWALGFPHRPESWPGMRVADALTREELAPLERWVRQQTGARSLWQEVPPGGERLDHNVVQRVGARESGARPHTDSRKVCTYAAVIYLSPDPDPGAGTSFYRLRSVGGRPGGNCVEAPHANLVEALGTRQLAAELLIPDVVVENVYNRMLLYRANIIHSATRYFGDAVEERRTTALFFWMAR